MLPFPAQCLSSRSQGHSKAEGMAAGGGFSDAVQYIFSAHFGYRCGP